MRERVGCCVAVLALLFAISWAPSTSAEEANLAPASPQQYGRAQGLTSPALLEELAERLWDLEDDTRSGLRSRVAASLIYGLVHGDTVAVHQVLGPAVSMQVLFAGRSTRHHSVLERRFKLLHEHHANRLERILAEECIRTKVQLIELEQRLRETQVALLELGLKTKRVPEVKYPANAEPFAAPCKPANTTAVAPLSRANTSAEVLDEVSRSRRVAFHQELEDDLIYRLTATRADLAFLVATDVRASQAIGRAEDVVRDAGHWWSSPFIDAHMGYAFQISESGLTKELGGLSTGLGIGVGPGPAISVGVLLVSPRRVGGYISFSMHLID